MNIALSAVVISILLIHPFVLYFSLYLGKYTRAIPKFSLFEALLGSAIISLLIHASAVSFIGEEIRFDILIKVLGGELKSIEGSLNNFVLKQAILDFALYNLILIIVMCLIGRLCRKILLYKNFHAYNELLHLYHEWWYFFNGYSYEEERIINYDIVFIRAEVNTKTSIVIYYGYLVGFETNGRDLDRIFLVNAGRKPLTEADDNDEDQDISPIPLEGLTFSLKYNDITRLSVDFIVLDNEPENAAGLQTELV